MKKYGYQSIYNTKVKRYLDIIIGLILLIVSFPFLILASVLILLEDGPPVFYTAERGGYKGIPFKTVKFRSMVNNPGNVGGGTTAYRDPRITKVGYFLRKTKLDEIPQFLLVVTGKMSIIGPRPELLLYTDQYQGEELLIFEVKPGITDYSSLEFINLDEIVGQENADEIYEKVVLKRKNELRVRYAKNVSFTTDLYIFCMTVYKVLQKTFRFILKKEHR